MRKKGMIGSIMVLLLAMLSGCCISHEWKEATCTEPSTCAKCEEIEGEALGHTWVEATCAEPKHCSVCGETEGEALAHTLTEADYQQASTCTVCGAIVGEPLQADFEKYGLECTVELNKIYDSVTMCYDAPEITTNAKIVFSNYKVFDSDEDHPAVEGYEWRTVDLTHFLYDDNYYQYGYSIGACQENYYDIVGHDESSVYNEEEGYTSFTVTYNGVEYTECRRGTEASVREYAEDRISCIITRKVFALVPVGYDGYVYGVRNSQVEWGEGQHLFDLDNTDTLFFRFANPGDMEPVSELSVEDINLTYEQATLVVHNLRSNIQEHVDGEAISYFDLNNSLTVGQDEIDYIIRWAFDNYNTEKSSELSDETIIRAAADYLAQNLDKPEEKFMPGE